MVDPRHAIIIGGGPAGLTAAYELLRCTDIAPVVLEQITYMGGLSRTVNYKGNRIDIGGDRFFSKSDRALLVRSLKSRIYFLRHFFGYPVRLIRKTLFRLGALRKIWSRRTILPDRLRINQICGR